MDTSLSLGQLLKKMYSSKLRFTACILLSICEALFYGWIFAYEVKTILGAVEAGDARQLHTGMMELIISVVFVAVIKILHVKCKTHITYRLVIEIEDQFIRAYNNRYCTNKDESNKLTAIQNTIPSMAEKAVEYIFGLIYLIFVLAAAVIYGITISIITVFIGVVASGAMVFFTKRLGKNIQNCTKESEAAVNEVYGTLWEYNDNLEILPFLEEKNTYAHLEAAINRENILKIRAGKLTNMSRIFLRFSNVGTILLGGVVGGILIYLQKITSSDLMALLIILPTISDQLFQIPSKINEFSEIKGMCAVLVDFFGDGDKLITKNRENKLGKIKKIEFREFSLPVGENYKAELEPVVLEQGKVYGIFGPSGVGKTTLFQTLLKIHNNFSGRIILNGRFSLNDISHDEWWNRVLYVDQENTVFPGSLKENICMASEYEKERFEYAVRMAALEPLLSDRTDLYSNVSIENMSSGERQQVCLARLFYLQKDVVLLDEATSALSPQREREVLGNITEWARQNGCIVLMISHSKEIRECCDRVIEMKQGS